MGPATLLPSAEFCSLMSFLVSVWCTMTLLTGKIVYNFVSLGVFCILVGFFGESP